MVYLVGAGPGQADLLTLRACQCLKRADLVIYDRLVPARLLDIAAPSAERLCINDLGARHVERGPHIQERLIAAARQGKRVVRLKGGDPLLFGRGGEEAEALAAAGIPFEIIPGVTAALGAAAFAGIPLTHRSYASAVAFVAGHEDSAKKESAVDWHLLARFPGTIVVYMGIGRLQEIVASLVESGKDPLTPAAAIQQATLGMQRTIVGELANLPQRVQDANLEAPAVVIVGDVVRARPTLNWFESLPLFGKRVLVTRPQRQSGAFLARLEELGATPILLPVVEICPPADWTPVDLAIDNLDRFDWLVFTSVNGVNFFLHRLREKKLDLRALGRISIAVIGPGTARALADFNLIADLVPEEYRSESLASALSEKVRGKRVLLARADQGRDLLRLELEKVAQVTQVVVYRQMEVESAPAAGAEIIRKGQVDFVALTSSNIARALLGGLDNEARRRIQGGQVRLVSISPVTSAAICEMGLGVAGQAVDFTPEGVIDAIVALAKGKPCPSPDVAKCVPAEIAKEGGRDHDDDIDDGTDAFAKGELEE
jgi:uroporphyrinogen III methyltransferase/synthase